MAFFEGLMIPTIYIWSSAATGDAGFQVLERQVRQGKARVNEFLDSKHRLQSHDNLIMGHASIVEMQAAMGDSGFLDV